MYKINKDWSQMTDIEQRKTLAQDAILHTRSQFFVIEEGKYCYIHPNINQNNLKESLKQVKSCQVCAMGGLMASMIIKNNEFKGEWNSLDIVYKLKNIFSEEHLRLIEAAFEKSLIDHTLVDLYNEESKQNEEIVNIAISFGRNYIKSSEERFIAIMENIINDENGKFLSYKF